MTNLRIFLIDNNGAALLYTGSAAELDTLVRQGQKAVLETGDGIGICLKTGQLEIINEGA